MLEGRIVINFPNCNVIGMPQLAFVLILVEDEEETIEEQEAKEGNINHQSELSNLVKEGKCVASLFSLESSVTTGENMV